MIGCGGVYRLFGYAGSAGGAGGEISLFATENKTPLHRLDAMALIRSRR
jgi:hypothetical protein